MILLDTSVLIEALGAGGTLAPALRSVFAEGERVGLPTLVAYEWLRGPRIPEELEAQQALLPLEDAVPFGPHEATLAAHLYGEVARPRGREIDLAIAACAISWGASLWTLNERDFADIPGLKLKLAPGS